MRGISLLDDILFKMVFGTAPNQALLRALLNALLGLTGKEKIAELEILNPLLDRDHALQKGVILDVRARDARGWQFNVEVQVAGEPAFVERALYYLTRLFADQLERGDPYTRINRTIGIALVDFVLFKDLEALHSTYRMREMATGRPLTDVLELHFIELSKFKGDRPQELRTPFEKWLHVLKFGELYGDRLESIPEELKDEEGIVPALEQLRRASASEQVREILELRRKAEHDEATRLERAQNEGIELGVEKGRQESLRETALKMRDAGMDAETILKITGLRLEDLE